MIKLHTVTLVTQNKKQEIEMKFKPIHDRVLVRRDESQTKIGGIFLPETAQAKRLQGTVLAVGDGPIINNERFAPLDVKEGDRVIFGQFSGTEVEIGDEKLLILREEDIFGVFTE